MAGLRVFLIVAWAVIMVITYKAWGADGGIAGDVFMSDIKGLSWRAQFNVDFLVHLVLLGTWVAWRNRFRPIGIALGVFCVLGGGAFALVYIFVASIQAKGSVQKLLLGHRIDSQTARDSGLVSKY